MDERRTPPSRIELRARLERMRADFSRLVDEVSDPKWGQRSTNTRWTNGEVLTHLLQRAVLVPREIDHARHGKNLLNLPAGFLNGASFLRVKWLARKHSRRSLKVAFDRAVDDTLAALDGVRDDEWHKGARFFGAGFRDIEQIIRAQPEHFAMHAAGVRAALGPGAPRVNLKAEKRRGRR